MYKFSGRSWSGRLLAGRNKGVKVDCSGNFEGSRAVNMKSTSVVT
jgi:hypothetical protein